MQVEDWLLAQNHKLIHQLRRIRKSEDRAGKGKPLSEIARRLVRVYRVQHRSEVYRDL